jgi:hypothetical protein
MKNPYSRGGTLTITMGPMTRAQCGPGAMDTQIARDLSHVRTYVFAGSNLNLVMAEGGGTYFWAPLRPADG